MGFDNTESNGLDCFLACYANEVFHQIFFKALFKVLSMAYVYVEP